MRTFLIILITLCLPLGMLTAGISLLWSLDVALFSMGVVTSFVSMATMIEGKHPIQIAWAMDRECRRLGTGEGTVYDCETGRGSLSLPRTSRARSGTEGRLTLPRWATERREDDHDRI